MNLRALARDALVHLGKTIGSASQRCVLLALALAGPAAAQIVMLPFAEPVGTPLLSGVAAGDVNEDGQVDIVSMPVGVDPSIVRVHLGDGSGGFTPGTTISLGTVGGRGELRDLDGDGHLDLLLAASLFADTAGAQWRLGAGDGSFGAPQGFDVDYFSGEPASFVRSFDLDGDGDRDYLVVQPGGPGLYPWAPYFGRISIVLDTPSGWAVSMKFSDPGTTAVDLGDVDGDGLPDLVASNELGQSVTVFRGLGAGAFADKHSLPLGGAGTDLHLVELTGDVRMDAIVADESNYRLLTLKGKADGTFGLLQIVPLGTGILPESFEMGDLDGDGVADLVVCDSAYQGGDSGGISIVKGAADGSFALVTRVAGLVIPSRAALADLVEDGRPDAAVADGDEFDVARNVTYPVGSPFTDLGSMQTPSGTLTPIQFASGDLLPGTPVSFDVFTAPANHPVTLVLGFQQAYLPFKGLLLVPAPDVLLGPFLSDAAGHLALGGSWPAGVPAGTELVTQFWFPFAIGPAGLAASNAVSAIVP